MEILASFVASSLLQVTCLIGVTVAAHSTCSIPSTQAGKEATLTCNFGENLQNNKVPFVINYYKDNTTQTARELLACQWGSSSYSCPSIYPNVDFNNKVSNTVSILLPAAKETEGKYVCRKQTSPSDQPVACWFRLTPVVSTSSSSDEVLVSTKIGTVVGIIAVLVILGVAGAVLYNWKKEELKARFCNRRHKDAADGVGSGGEEEAAVPLSAGPIFKGPPPAEHDDAADGKENGSGDGSKKKKRTSSRSSSEDPKV